jgi:hypothetical protein
LECVMVELNVISILCVMFMLRGISDDNVAQNKQQRKN